MTPFHWTADHVGKIAHGAIGRAPAIVGETVRRFAPELDLWDHWPVLEADGGLADFEGRHLVFFLSAPVFDDPDVRHGVARLRLFSVAGDNWRDLGPVFPDGFSPGSREWAGSAIVDRDPDRIRLYFTATGERGETSPTFQQRIFVTCTPLDRSPDGWRPGLWSAPEELIRPDDVHYQSRHDGDGAVGTIKAFRDPFVFRDLATGREHMVFTGSCAASSSRWNGVVGWASRSDHGWTAMPPIVLATQVNNELERPHVVQVAGRYHLFWSTQSKVFAPGIDAPTGLYGIVADHLDGPWSPLNGSGLVFANPVDAPDQAYSWQVLPDLSVWSFADRVAAPHRPAINPAIPFAGAPAPRLRIRLNGDDADLEA